MWDIAFPILYTVALIGILTAAGKYMRSKTVTAKDEGYFPENIKKLEYEELSEQYSPEEPNGRSVLVTALVERAAEAIRRVFRIREEKPSLSQMVSNGIIGETLLEKLKEAEVEINAEMQELMTEANIYKPDWGKTFLQEVSQMVQAQMQQQQKSEEEEASAPPAQNPIAEEEERERLAKELIEEEEEEKRSSVTKRKGPKVKKIKS